MFGFLLNLNYWTYIADFGFFLLVCMYFLFNKETQKNDNFVSKLGNPTPAGSKLETFILYIFGYSLISFISISTIMKMHIMHEN